VFDLRNGAGADDDLRFAAHDRLDELGNVVRVVLVIRVRIHDHAGPGTQGGVESRHETAGETLVPAEVHDVIHAVGAGDFDRFVDATVGNDEPFHPIKAGDLPWQSPQRDRQRLLFIVAGDLDNQLLHERAQLSHWERD
jgi:hypothetical protein